MLRDKDIREPLFDFLEEMCGKIRILEEKQIGKSRTDIVMVLPELAHIQELNEMPKYKEKSKQFVIDKIAERIPEDTLSKQISNALFERDYNEIEHVIQEFKKTRTVTTRKRRAGPIRKGRRP
ncbi:hypothetical protein [Enterocloster clostridioformis]|uniref:Uncharacterized protein n=1 Tax=Enterocloster clostridioformis TaxID=1531 RepID=A0A1I0JHJ4_9FIRM|nr:hypothetical protein [Enterocloster clostridioformis]SEU09489.1 hypothetical protein SAMN05216521_105730 [Enterocloster clostridioformis]SEW46205.1 hypothetical protein SAMN05216528_105630 [Enterocloster clostridioformis]